MFRVEASISIDEGVGRLQMCVRVVALHGNLD